MDAQLVPICYSDGDFSLQIHKVYYKSVSI